jgi:hypothetical protein
MEAYRSDLRRTSVLMLSVAAFTFVVCEMNVILRLRGNSGKVTLSVLPLLLVLPLVTGLNLRRRIKQWEASGELGAAASAHINFLASALVFFSYMLFMMISNPR